MKNMRKDAGKLVQLTKGAIVKRKLKLQMRAIVTPKPNRMYLKLGTGISISE